jgi:hypothetical protein
MVVFAGRAETLPLAFPLLHGKGQSPAGGEMPFFREIRPATPFVLLQDLCHNASPTIVKL